MRIVVTGSYNGQDSLGDECLMHAVLGRLRRLRPDAEIELQLHGTASAAVHDCTRRTGVAVARGLQSSMWRAAQAMERLGLPASRAKPASERGIRLARRLGLFGAHEAWRRLERCDAFFIFGGSQFAGPWFALNAPAYLRSAQIVRQAGGRVYLGPQQFGPLAAADARRLDGALRGLADDWRTRNPRDVALLAPDEAADAADGARGAREIFDEVFAATDLYPSTPPGEAAHILVNLRAMTFDDAHLLEAGRYGAMAALVDNLMAHYRLPAVFFAVSDASFCDDEQAFAAVRAASRAPQQLSSVGRVRSAAALLALATRARVTLSMSFHGCLLAAIAGAPFVAVSQGRYYDYKYTGFDKYAGGQAVPVVPLATCDAATESERIVRFVDTFDRCRVREAREAADRLADAFYGAAVGAAVHGRG